MANRAPRERPEEGARPQSQDRGVYIISVAAELAGVEAVLDLEEQLQRMQARLERLEREMREAIEQVHKRYRRELVLYDPAQSRLPTPRRWTSTSSR